jgi:hypothetical protein
MKITSSTELMKNQKHAIIMAPDEQFEVLQTQGGNALFFSIGTDGIFYITREIPADTHGWSKVDLSSHLKTSYQTTDVIVAKSFDVAQYLEQGTTDVALVLTISGTDGSGKPYKYDHLYACMGNTDDVWENIESNGLALTLVDYDGGGTVNKSTLTISDINFAESGQCPYLQTDILQNPTDAQQLIDRYWVDPMQVTGSGIYWNLHNLTADLSAGKIKNYIGQSDASPAFGTYTFGSIMNELELMFTPFYNAFDTSLNPSPIRFVLPASATAMALSMDVNNEPLTDMFVAAGSSLYFLGHAGQADMSTPAMIYTHSLLMGVQSLRVNNDDSQTIVWGLNEQGQIFYLKCAAGMESDTSAWSYPVAILEGVEGIATFINSQQSNVVIFAHMSDDSMIQLSQDPTTTHWVQRSIKLPGAAYDDMVEEYTFTTHIHLTDDNNVPLNNEAISITSSAVCSVYINNEYHVLYPNDPLSIPCDESGGINIIQAIDTLGGVCFTVTDGTMQPPPYVNPMTNVLAKLNGVTGKSSDLNVTVKDELGNPSQLITDPSVTDTDKANIANYIAQFIAIWNSNPPQLPADGSQQPGDSDSLAAVASAKPSAVFGIHQQNGHFLFYNSVEEAITLGVPMHTKNIATSAATSAGLLGDYNGIEILAGDGWNWLKNEVENVVTWEIRKFGNINHFFFTIADQMYHFALKCAHDIASGVHFILNKIAVAFEDMVKWLGSLFSWTDILNTHRVLKNMFLQYSSFCISNIDTVKALLNTAVTDAVNSIDAWAGIAPANMPLDSYSNKSSSGNNTDSGQHSAQSNWGNQQAKNNGPNTDYTNPASEIGDLLNDFMTAIEVEGEIAANAVDEIKDILAEIHTLPMATVIQRLVAVIADVLLESTVNIIDAFLSVAETLLEGLIGIFETELQIPVLSVLYKYFTKGDTLSVLDLICLVIAVPVNVIYKLSENGEAPFPDDATTVAIYKATDFESFVQACVDQQSASQVQVKAQAQAKSNSLGFSKPIPVWDDATNTKWAKIANYCAFGGSILVSAFALWKQKQSSSHLAAVAYAGAYLPYVAPNIIGAVQYWWETGYIRDWVNDLNFGLACAGALKSFVDITLTGAPDFVRNPVPAVAAEPVLAGTGKLKAVTLMAIDDDDDDPVDPPVDPGPPALPAAPTTTTTWASPLKQPKVNWQLLSPFFETGINAAWEVPVVLGFVNSQKNTNDIWSLVGNTLFNVGGIITPFGSFGPPPWPMGVWAAQTVCNLGYGASMLVIALDKASDNDS